MTAPQLEVAITEPARIAGAEVDDRLVRALLEQARSRQGEDTRVGCARAGGHE
jgi:hypothetical protein